MCATYREKQNRSHFESFANKIYTGIREIKPEYAEKRAIWELFQNALDTVDENGIIEISKTEKGLLFKHNGRPFKDDEFGGLIKQFSVGKSYGDNKDKLGQYGTGFISTHVYGKVITINGSIKLDDGTHRTLKDFKLDRVSTSIDNLTDKLLDQDKLIDDLCENTNASETLSLTYTSFEYHANTSEKEHITSMLGYVESILPYIFCFNDKLQVVKVLKEKLDIKYIRTDATIGVVNIIKNDESISIPILYEEEFNLKVIIGDDNRILQHIPKQFLYYPLMETVDAGFNFIIHANDFKPNKERDYLYQDGANEELKADVENNEKLLKSAFELVLKEIKNNPSISFLDVIKIEFKNDDSAFNIKLKSNFVNEIRFLEKLSIGEGNCSLNSIGYFDKSILELDVELTKLIYELLKQFKKLPTFDIYCELAENVNNWNENIEEKFDLYTLENVAELIINEGINNYYYIKDKLAYKVFIKQISENVSLLNKLKLIPNIHGDFKLFENLVKWDVNETSLTKIVDNINVSISEQYIHEDFQFLENIIVYKRENFKDNFSKFCNELIDDIIKEKDSAKFSNVRFNMLLESLNDYVGLNKKTKLNIETSAFYERVFDMERKSLELTDPTVDTNYQPAIKLLANLYLKYLSEENISEHIPNLKEIIEIMFKNTNLKEELLHKLLCLPNQNFKLKSQNELKRDYVKDNEFKNKYDEITKNNIRNELVLDGFETFLQHLGLVSGSTLGEEIEISLNTDKRFIPVQVGIIDTLITLIEKISEKPNTWGEWLHNINKVKEEILMHKFKDGKTRSSLFSILTKNEKTIELLGDLAKEENLEDLVKKAKERQKEEYRKTNHLNYINYIGLTIQDLIQKQLGLELANVISVLKSEDDKELTTQEEQNGQDFIIYKDKKPIYFLEVKSKWDENGRFALSKNQTEKCAKEKNRYAVISVNVDRYKRKHAIDIDNIPFEDLKEFIKVNDDLGEDFEKLVIENVTKIELNDSKLIEYRGSIPQKLIDEKGIEYDNFIKKLIEKIRIE